MRCAAREQLHRVLDLDVRRQHEDRRLRELLADRARRRRGPRSCASAASGCRRSRGRAAARGRARAARAPSPAWPTTSKPDRSSRLARPSRRRTSSSAMTTRPRVAGIFPCLRFHCGHYPPTRGVAVVSRTTSRVNGSRCSVSTASFRISRTRRSTRGHAHLGERLAHGRERRMDDGRVGAVVEADDGQLVRDPDAARPRRSHRSHGDHVAEREDRGRRRVKVEQHGRRLGARLEVEVRFQLERGVERDPGGRERAAIGPPSLLGRDPPRRPGDRRDTAVPSSSRCCIACSAPDACAAETDGIRASSGASGSMTTSREAVGEQRRGAPRSTCSGSTRMAPSVASRSSSSSATSRACS